MQWAKPIGFEEQQKQTVKALLDFIQEVRLTKII